MQQDNQREKLTKAKRWVVKIGSALLTANGKGLATEAMQQWVEQIATLRKQGIEVVLVSSGSVAQGMVRLGWASRPRAIHELQVAAAVGQMGLIQAYESFFRQHNISPAQVLLTHADLSNRQRYLNARSALRTMLELGVIPIINENDTVATDEIRFGDNDTLGALVANLVEADLLVILTDQQGLYDADPRTNKDAKLVSTAPAASKTLDNMAAGSAGALGRGGMMTKVRAARLAARSGAHTVIVGGAQSDVLTRVAAGEDIGTLLTPEQERLAARKQWLAGHLQTRGRLVIDAGAVRVLLEEGRSLLPVGVSAIEGGFQRGEMVTCVDLQGVPIANGLVNYSADEARQIIGKPSHQIEGILGYVDEPELIHRDNLVLLTDG
ncbi:glutamate 5-kinase [Zooshikella marina]|uniref:glutamate 5-kinase n=1 Tax=Zooshikella ganghwensis TaxID=202772 RepID=UPI000409B881|nr:glutamate 5-kinase [Zooshikella ganghwensis]MBU2707422.1 glutamate 5-kinase [Zooshikella ganghwensis]